MHSIWRRTGRLALRHRVRYNSTASEPSSPPLLLKIRRDLKSAMKEKDTPRLNVLRAIISDVTNASKGPSPMQTEQQMFSLMNQRISSSKKASEEFAQAKRDDLKAKQDTEIAVMQEYAEKVELVSDQDHARTVENKTGIQ